MTTQSRDWSWVAAGATVAEYEHLNDDHVNLDAAFEFLCDEADCLPTTDRKAAFMAGFAAYQQKQMIRVAGKPHNPGSETQ